jgi:hypothetical protein
MLDVDLDVSFATKTRDLAAVARCGAAENFDGDLVAERGVLRGVDDADSAGADLPSDPVLAA